MSDEVEITNHRADATQNESLIGMARTGADAFGYTAELRIDRGLAQLLRLRVSQLNNCSYCLNLHYEAARDAGIPRAKIDTLTAWWETDLHSEAEQAPSATPRRLPGPPIRKLARPSSASTTGSRSTSTPRRSSRSSASS
jgi:AhpD family alkylhydroperoxidase